MNRAFKFSFPLILLLVFVFSSFKIVSNSTHPTQILSAYVKVTEMPTPTPTLTPILIPTLTPTPFSTPVPMPTIILTAPGNLEELFQKYSHDYNIDVNLLKKIANCESHFGTGAANGPYGGMFQFAEPIWTSTRKLMGFDPNPDLRFSAEESIKTAAFLLSQGHTSLWQNCIK